MDKDGIRFIRKADNVETFRVDTETGDAFFKGDLSAEKIIAGIAQIGGLSADYIKAGTISYDRLKVEYARATNVEWSYYSPSPTGPSDLQVELISSAASQDSYNVFKATYTNIDEFGVIVHHNPLKTVSGIGNIQLSSDGSWWSDFGFSLGWKHDTEGVFLDTLARFEYLKNTTTALTFLNVSHETGQLWVRFQRHAIS